MSASSGTVRLFVTAAFCIASATATAFILSHRAEFRNVFASLTAQRFEKAGATNRSESRSAESGDADVQAAETSGEVTLRAGNGGHFEASAEINGRSVDVRINDRGPYIKRRIIDLSRAAAQALGVSGTDRVEISVLDKQVR